MFVLWLTPVPSPQLQAACKKLSVCWQSTQINRLCCLLGFCFSFFPRLYLWGEEWKHVSQLLRERAAEKFFTGAVKIVTVELSAANWISFLAGLGLKSQLPDTPHRGCRRLQYLSLSASLGWFFPPVSWILCFTALSYRLLWFPVLFCCVLRFFCVGSLVAFSFVCISSWCCQCHER